MSSSRLSCAVGLLLRSVGKVAVFLSLQACSLPAKPRGKPDEYGYYKYRASLVAQQVKNLPKMRETWVRSLCWEDPLEKGKATHSSILAWRIPWAV